MILKGIFYFPFLMILLNRSAADFCVLTWYRAYLAEFVYHFFLKYTWVFLASSFDRQALAPQSPAWSMDFELGVFQNSPLSHPAPRVLALKGRAGPGRGGRVVLVPRAAKSTALSPGLRHRSPPVSSERGKTSAKFTSSSAPPSTCVNRETVHRLTV